MSVRVNNIVKNYGAQVALNDVSFEIKEGEIVGFLGPNGAGKSTLMKIITGYISASSGTVLLSEKEVTETNLITKQDIGYLPEHNPLYLEMYVREYLTFVAEIHEVSKKNVEAVVEKVGLLPEAHKKIESLSKGYRQRVGLAAAIIHNPKVLILDEPTTGLDPNQLIEIRALIKEIGKNKIILFSTHILQEVEAVCDRVLVLNKGVLVADEKLSVLKQQQDQVIEVAFDFQIEKRFFNEIPDLESVNNIFDTTWELVFKTQEDRRSSVFDFANSNGLKIVQMNSKNKNLEHLFKELTAV